MASRLREFDVGGGGIASTRRRFYRNRAGADTTVETLSVPIQPEVLKSRIFAVPINAG